MQQLTIDIDAAGTIENPAVQQGSNAQARRRWGAYMHRQGDKIKPIPGAFLHRYEIERLDVSRVPVGAYIGFGAEILSPSGEWGKTRMLYQVRDRDSSSITLEAVQEWNIPFSYDAATAPECLFLMDGLGRAEAYIKYLQTAVQRLMNERRGH